MSQALAPPGDPTDGASDPSPLPEQVIRPELNDGPLERLINQPIAPIVCGLVLFSAALVNPLDVEFRNSGEKSSVGLDWQVAMKLVVSAVAIGVGALGFLTNLRVRHVLFTTVPGVLLICLGSVFLATSVFALSEVANVCRVAALIVFGYVLFIPTVLTVIRLRSAALMILSGLTMHMIVSWTLYFFVPSIGVFEEELSGQTLVLRMAGTAHPNSVGRVGVLAIVIAIALLRGTKINPVAGRARWILVLLIILGIATAIQTKSRTAMGAGIIAVFAMQMDRFFTRQGGIAALGAVVIVVSGLIVFGLGPEADQFGDKIVAAGTKTGDASELTSATGRTVIWAEAIELIKQRPLTGWGLNSAPILLADFSQHTHNLLLHGLFSGGVFAGLLMAILVLWTLFAGLTSVEPLVRGVAAYVLVSGFFEDTVLETFPFSSTLLWFSVLFAPYVYRTTSDRASPNEPLLPARTPTRCPAPEPN